jgi:hypothetical protein
VAWLIGIDEAGLGPNLGPLVLAATTWRIPEETLTTLDLYSPLHSILTAEPLRGDTRLHVADSKQVYSPSRGVEQLERSVLTALAVTDQLRPTLREQCQALIGPAHPPDSRDARTDTTADPNVHGDGPWSQRAASGARKSPPRQQRLFADDSAGDAGGTALLSLKTADVAAPWDALDCRLPLVAAADTAIAQRWRDISPASGITLNRVAVRIVRPLELNQALDHWDNKSTAVSQLAFEFIRGLDVLAETREPVVLCIDKQGGRNRYQALLEQFWPGVPIECDVESADASVYRLGNMRWRFQPRAECFLPVALASMVAKYLREASLEVFNGYWQSLVPGLKPTKGYPQDARRFRAEIAETQQRLGISDAVLWRQR